MLIIFLNRTANILLFSFAPKVFLFGSAGTVFGKGYHAPSGKEMTPLWGCAERETGTERERETEWE